jgi:hypothetical protein
VSVVDVTPGLAREQRLRPPFAVISAAAGVLLLLAALLQQYVGAHVSVQEVTLALVTENKRSGVDIVAGIIEAVGSLAIAATLVFLLDASRLRNERVAPFIRILAVLGALLASIYSVGYSIVFAQKAHQFVSSGAQTYPQAHTLTASGPLVILQLLGLVGALLVALSIVLASLQAMRVGLLTRFMGYVGMFAGALVLFQFTPLPVVETFWFLGLAVLFLGRWPSGQPKAWETGRAEAWPTAQAARDQRVRAAQGRQSGSGRGGARQPAPTAGGGLAALFGRRTVQQVAERKGAAKPAGDAKAAGATNGRSPSAGAKRKRKRRK